MAKGPPFKKPANKKKRGRGVDAKGRSKTGGKFVALPDPLITSEAWRSLSGSAVRYYIELRRRFNGWNNGDLHLTLDEAATVLRMGRNTTVKAQKELLEKGFIYRTQRSGFHQHVPTLWALTDMPLKNQPPPHRYKTWKPKIHSPGAVLEPLSVPKRHSQTPAGGSRGAETALTEANSSQSRGAETAPILYIYHGGAGQKE